MAPKGMMYRLNHMILNMRAKTMYPMYPMNKKANCFAATKPSACAEVLVVIEADMIIKKPMMPKRIMAICMERSLPFGRRKLSLVFFITLIVPKNHAPGSVKNEQV